MTNDDLAKLVDTSDEWIRDRTGIRERRIAARRGDVGHLAPGLPPGARDGRRRPGVGRPADRGDRDARHDVPLDRGARRRRARDARRGRLRPLGRLHRVHVRARAGLRHARGRPRQAGARRRRRRALEDPRLDRPLDAGPLRRRRRRGRARARRPGRLPRLRARRRRRRRQGAPAPRQRLAALRQSAPLSADERPRGVQVRDAGDGHLGRGGSRRVRQDGRRRRRLRSPSGERPHHRSRCQEAGLPRGEGRRQRRPLRQHVVGLDPAGARRCGRRRPAPSRESLS